jgi:hypothetical protein
MAVERRGLYEKEKAFCLAIRWRRGKVVALPRCTWGGRANPWARQCGGSRCLAWVRSARCCSDMAADR